MITLLTALNAYAWESPCKKNNTPPPPPFEQGDDGLGPTVNPAFGHPARVNLTDSYNTFATVSYLYWLIGEDGLDVATTSQFSSQLVGLVPNTPVSTRINQNEQYHSGFKIGVGYMLPEDDWILRADYTRIHGSTHLHAGVDDLGGSRPALQMTNWFYQISPSRQQTPGVTSISSKWHVSVDWLDVVMQRPFYTGRRLTLNPFMGLRASWITQTLAIKVSGILNFSTPPAVAQSYNTSHNWALGPRFGLDGRFLLGYGIRFQGTVAGNILYNNYTHVKHREDSFAPNNPNSSPITFLARNNGNMRTMVEADLGLGWGMYFGNQYHFDLSASYDFNYLPAQLQMRVLNDIQIDGVNASSHALFLHGLTVTSTFNF